MGGRGASPIFGHVHQERKWSIKLWWGEGTRGTWLRRRPLSAPIPLPVLQLIQSVFFLCFLKCLWISCWCIMNLPEDFVPSRHESLHIGQTWCTGSMRICARRERDSENMKIFALLYILSQRWYTHMPHVEKSSPNPVETPKNSRNNAPLDVWRSCFVQPIEHTLYAYSQPKTASDTPIIRHTQRPRLLVIAIVLVIIIP